MKNIYKELLEKPILTEIAVSYFLRIRSVTACFLGTLFYNYRTINSRNIKSLTKRRNEKIFTWIFG